MGAILVVAAISLSALVADVDLVASIVSFGALSAFTMVNLSVIATYLVRAERRTISTYLLYGVIPAVGFLLTAWLWTSLTPVAVVLGLTWMVIGVSRLLWHTRMFSRPVPRMHLSE